MPPPDSKPPNDSKAPSNLVYVYGVCHAAVALPPWPQGFRGAVSPVVGGDIAAIAEAGLGLESLGEDDPQLLNAVLSHDRVICELAQRMTILPMRFGIQLASLDQLRQHLASQGETYRARLTALANKAEFHLKLSPATTPLAALPDGLRGREYFLAKKQRLQAQTSAQQQQQTELATWLGHLQTTYPISVSDVQPGQTNVYLLLNRAEAAALQRWVNQWQAQTTHWQTILSGPLPPYHFV
ncbi:MAG: GvpL/GvpF family gas vesicle protein [Nodosilinea sp.]